MDQLKLLKDSLLQDRPGHWEDIPDIELYMDQVVGYMPRQHIGLSEGEALTPAMINNYVKKGLLPRANGKRYGREHLAYLTAICLFKQVLSVSDTDTLLKLQLEDSSIEEFYETYRKSLDACLAGAAEALADTMDRQELKSLILDTAISAYTQKLICERLLHALEASNEPQNKEPQKKAKPAKRTSEPDTAE